MKSHLVPNRFLVVLVAALSLMSCNPKINEFSVWPLRICKDDTVHVSYDVTGQGTLKIVTTGNEIVETTSYILIVERFGKTEFAQKDVIRWLTTTEKELVFRTLPLGRDSIVSIDTLRGENWKSGPPLGTIFSKSDRPLRITHAGKEFVLGADGTPTSALQSLPVDGAWIIKAALLPGEILGDPQHSPPDRFRITTLFCK